MEAFAVIFAFAGLAFAIFYLVIFTRFLLAGRRAFQAYVDQTRRQQQADSATGYAPPLARR